MEGGSGVYVEDDACKFSPLSVVCLSVEGEASTDGDRVGFWRRWDVG